MERPEADGAEWYLDSHVHFWDPGLLRYPWLAGAPGIGRGHLPAHLRADLDRASVQPPAGVVAVEADCEPGRADRETQWLLALDDPASVPVLGVVAHLPLEHGERCAGRVDELRRTARVVGIRRLLQDEPPGFALRAEFLRGLGLLRGTGLTFDLCIRHHQLAEVTELVRRHPEIDFVLDHLGKPPIPTGPAGGWAEQLSRLAALPRVRCKLSGLATEAAPGRRAAADLVPWLRQAIDAFGPDRCMFGSDWPVLHLATSYPRWLEAVRSAVDDLPADQRRAVLGGTALATYGLPRDRTPAGRAVAQP